MSLLTPEEGRILTRAIRDALPPPTPRPPPPRISRTLLRFGTSFGIGIAFAGVIWMGLGYLLGTHVALPTQARSTDPDLVTHLSASGHQVTWHANRITTDRLTILGPSADVRISLPFPIALCPEVARSFGTDCEDGAVTGIALPAELSFSREVATTVDGDQVLNFDLDRLVDVEDPENRVFGFLTRGGNLALSLTVTKVTTLTMSSAGAALPELEFRPGGGGLPADHRLSLEFATTPTGSVGQSDPAAEQTNLVLEHVTAIEALRTCGATGELQGFAGKIVLFGSGTKLIDPATTVSVIGDTSDRTPAQDTVWCSNGQVTASLSIGNASVLAQLNADPATSVQTDEGELLPTRYADRPQFWGPIVTAAMTVLVLELTIGQVGDLVRRKLDKIGGVSQP